MSNVVPFTFDNHLVRAISADGAPMLHARDSALVLGYANPAEAYQTHCKHLKRFSYRELLELGFPAPNPRGEYFIPESDVYRLVMRSKLEDAERFQDWVMEEVLPSIREKGTYTAPKAKASRRSAGAITQAKVALLLHREMVSIGVEPNLSLATVMQAVEDEIGFPTERMRRALTVEPANIASLNQTQLGERVGLSSREIGKRLRDNGLMTTNDRGDRLLTDSGKSYGSMVPFTKNGHSSYEPRWFESVLSVIAPAPQEAS